MTLSKAGENITKVPSATELIDICLSQTQRGTPTVIHKGYKLGRIRGFYIRKIKFCTEATCDRLTRIVTEFPQVDSLPPIYRDLINILYDRDTYKIALGQLSNARNFLKRLCHDYVKLVKFADSLFKCKMLKRAALGRLVSMLRKLDKSLSYLESVREHLERLPNINPSGRSLLLAGFPNVGKSSFMNLVSRANVETAAYSFTTKNIYLGHFDYNYLNWQIFDTPGILNRDISERNIVEMTALAAIVNLNAALIYVIDVSEVCGHTIAEQVDLLIQIHSALINRVIVVCLNKVDLVDIKALDAVADLERLKEYLQGQSAEFKFIPTSTMDATNVDLAKKTACDMLLSLRVEAKVRQADAEKVAIRTTIVEPVKYKGATVARPAPVEKMELSSIELQEQYGGHGVYQHDIYKDYLLENPDWNYDIAPTLYEGSRVLEFYDPNIEQKMAELEAEETRLLASELELEEGVLQVEARMDQIESLVSSLREKDEFTRRQNKLKKARAGSVLPSNKLRTQRTAKPDILLSEHEQRLKKSQSSDTRRNRSNPVGKTRFESSMGKKDQLMVINQNQKAITKFMRKKGKSNDADRSVPDLKPKHLYSGKMDLHKRAFR